MPERSSRYQTPPQRRKTPSFSSSLLDTILRSIDETNEGAFQDDQQKQQVHDHDLMLVDSDHKRSRKLNVQKAHLDNKEDQPMPNLRRASMIDQWMETHNNKNNPNLYNTRKSTKKSSSVSSSNATTTFTPSTTSSEAPTTPSTYKSLPNSFTISRKTAEAVFRDDTQKTSSSSTQREQLKFIKSTKLKAMKIYNDFKKPKQQPISPRSRISAFIYSLFASSSSKKAKIEESIHNFRSLKKTRSIKLQDATMTCTSFSRSCMSKKQHGNGVKRSVRFYPENDTVIIHDQRDSDMIPKYERRWFTENNYTKDYKNFMVTNIEDENEDEDEDDLFELEIVGIGGYRQELPVFETTDLRKIRI